MSFISAWEITTIGGKIHVQLEQKEIFMVTTLCNFMFFRLRVATARHNFKQIKIVFCEAGASRLSDVIDSTSVACHIKRPKKL